MSERSLVFPAMEFEGRVERLQAELAGAQIDALLLTTPADIFYVTGFLTRFWESPARPWFVLVPQTGDPVAIIPAIGAELMGKTWMKDIRTWNAPNPEDDGVTLLADTISGLLSENASIGVPMGLETHLRMPLADYGRVQAAIAPRQFVDGTSVIQRVREIKSEAEIDKIRATCSIADRAFARMPEIAEAACPLDEVFRRFQMVLLEEGSDWVSYVAGGAGQSGYGDVISPASEAPIVKGDVLMLDTGAVREGYFCDFDRNFAVGPASKAVRKTHTVLWEATETALTQLRPGMLAKDVHALLSAQIKRLGCAPLGGRLGHGLGINLTEWPSFTPLDETELRENMVLTLEPGAVVSGDRILVHEENIVLRAHGAELLSKRAPRDMPELTA